jgi:hypothetical protein
MIRSMRRPSIVFFDDFFALPLAREEVFVVFDDATREAAAATRDFVVLALALAFVGLVVLAVLFFTVFPLISFGQRSHGTARTLVLFPASA